MNEAQVLTVEQMRQVLVGTQALEFRQAGDDQDRYGWIGAVLRRMDYNRLKKRPDRGVVLMYLQRLSCYSRAQVKRLVATWLTGRDKPLVKRYRAPEHAYARRYTDADVALLGESARHPFATDRDALRAWPARTRPAAIRVAGRHDCSFRQN